MKKIIAMIILLATTLQIQAVDLSEDAVLLRENFLDTFLTIAIRAGEMFETDDGEIQEINLQSSAFLYVMLEARVKPEKLIEIINDNCDFYPDEIEFHRSVAERSTDWVAVEMELLRMAGNR